MGAPVVVARSDRVEVDTVVAGSVAGNVVGCVVTVVMPVVVVVSRETSVYESIGVFVGVPAETPRLLSRRQRSSSPRRYTTKPRHCVLDRHAWPHVRASAAAVSGAARAPLENALEKRMASLTFSNAPTKVSSKLSSSGSGAKGLRGPDEALLVVDVVVVLEEVVVDVVVVVVVVVEVVVVLVVVDVVVCVLVVVVVVA